MTPERLRTPFASEVTFVRPVTFLDANGLGRLHGGVVMHQVDTAAGTAGARHVGGTVVTASIDELSFLAPVDVGDLLIVQARVNAAFGTSIEVGVRVEAEKWDGTNRRHTTSAYLVMVAIDKDGNPCKVPELICETDDEKRRAHQAAIRR
ncbi:MAG: acyl-CoA hydrolase, partial [Glaciecola sp.]